MIELFCVFQESSLPRWSSESSQRPWTSHVEWQVIIEKSCWPCAVVTQECPAATVTSLLCATKQDAKGTIAELVASEWHNFKANALLIHLTVDGHLWLRKKAYNFPWDPGASLLVFFPQKSQVPAPMNGHEERAAWKKWALPGLGHPHSREIPPRAHPFAGGYWQRHQALQSTGSYSARCMELWNKMPGYFLGFQRQMTVKH